MVTAQRSARTFERGWDGEDSNQRGNGAARGCFAEGPLPGVHGAASLQTRPGGGDRGLAGGRTDRRMDGCLSDQEQGPTSRTRALRREQWPCRPAEPCAAGSRTARWAHPVPGASCAGPAQSPTSDVTHGLAGTCRRGTRGRRHRHCRDTQGCRDTPVCRRQRRRDTGAAGTPGPQGHRGRRRRRCRGRAVCWAPAPHGCSLQLTLC